MCSIQVLHFAVFQKQSKGGLISICDDVGRLGWVQVWGSGIQYFDPPLEKEMLLWIMRTWFFVFSFGLTAYFTESQLSLFSVMGMYVISA